MQLHVHFRSVLPESKEQLQVAVHSPAVWDASSASKCSSDAYLQAAKRLRWSQQVRNAMGSLDGACAVGCDRLVDLVNMTWDNPSALDIQSVDGGVLAKGVVAAPDAGDAAAGESKSLRKHMLAATNNWVYACPIAGELWVRAGTACSI